MNYNLYNDYHVSGRYKVNSIFTNVGKPLVAGLLGLLVLSGCNQEILSLDPAAPTPDSSTSGTGSDPLSGDTTTPDTTPPDTTPVNTPDEDGKITIFDKSGTATGRGFVLSGELEIGVSEAFLTLTYPDGRLIIGDIPVEVDPETGKLGTRISGENLPVSTANVQAKVTRTIGGEEVTSYLNVPINRDVDEIQHLISRITFGPKPGLEERVREMGYEAFLDEQLNPQNIADPVFEALKAESPFDLSSWMGTIRQQSIQLLPTIYSEKQLQEIMAIFWDNHFHTQSSVSLTLTYEHVEKEAYRANAFGNFRDLLEISAKSPAMMGFLDNKDNTNTGMNENYARELLELHTVGVNSSYSEEDIIEVARILTGWGLKDLPRDSHDVPPEFIFVFTPEDHDTGDKYVEFIDYRVTGKTGVDGVIEGEELLDILAIHPDTAQYICSKLITHFVSDDTIETLQEACAATFLESNGDIKQVLTTIFLSDDFRSNTASFRNKFKNPYEFAASYARAFDLQIPLEELEFVLGASSGTIEKSGFDMYGFADPTGITDESARWMGAASLLSRIKEAITRVDGRSMDPHFRNTLLEFFYNNAPAQTPDGIAAYICIEILQSQCTQPEYETLKEAAIGPDGIFNPEEEGIEEIIIRVSQVAVGTITFQMQ